MRPFAAETRRRVIFAALSVSVLPPLMDEVDTTHVRRLFARSMGLVHGSILLTAFLSQTAFRPGLA